MAPWWHRIWVVAFVALIAAGSARAAEAGGEDPVVVLLRVEGVLGPLTARYLAREVGRVEPGAVRAVVVVLDTPGGLVTSTRAMAQTLMQSRVPVAVYVAPSGARAASGGMFLVLAAHVAAMAPGTNIGAAHPVGLGGSSGGEEETARAKAVNDAAALARALAETHDRNPEWAERAVRQSVSITADEALRERVVEMVVPDLDALLGRLEGRRVTTAAGPVTLRLEGTKLVTRSMTVPERLLQVITDPNVAFILFSLGLLGIAIELYSPGLLGPGLGGAIAVVLALVAFGTLPINWAGFALILLAVGLFVAELLTSGVGVLAAAGTVAFVVGALMLYRPLGPVSPMLPQLAVSPWVVGVASVVLAAVFLGIGRALLRSRHLAVQTGPEALVGRGGVATSELDPAGTVRVDTETWRALAEDVPIRAGERVRVVGVSGVTLRVGREPTAPGGAGER